ncbi:PDZ domain-containing short spindle 6 [Haematobia irritans]|uniref:PDZ domain-containing short spindle 6 n=1 Tax=Haematobia irritans TaxID=7368 RepID=UPI003F4F5741
MAAANAMSSSCQSIAGTLGNMASTGGVVGGGCLRSGNGNSNTTQYVMGTGSLGRLKLKTLGASDEELDFAQLSQSTHILGRVKSERFLSSKVDEDRRRRTIIVEKKNDSFGFTLQSYGIHYKKDQEVEMITYVDYVEYDGPAYKAGMREGDVILSINGQDMEKADHKTLVDFIKSCDSRMRMVVLFEDCVKKVNLHMRYIQLQTMLQNKMNELERICVRERELLEGKWKTHSLPARKKAGTTSTEGGGTETGNSPTDTEMNLPYYRPTLSTEDFTNIQRQSQQTIIPPPAQYMLSYHYFDPTYRYVMKPSISTNSSGDCFVTIGEPLSRAQSGDTTTAGPTSSHIFQSQRRSSVSQPPQPPPRTCEKHKPPPKQQQQPQQGQGHSQSSQPTRDPNGGQKPTKSSKQCHGRSCNPCIDFRWKSSAKTAALSAAGGNGDNVSLDAYDLASPCCDTQCVPTRRHTRHHHKEHSHKHKHRDRERESESKERPPRPKSQSHVSPGPTTRHHHHHHHIGQDTGAGHHHGQTHQYQYFTNAPQSQHSAGTAHQKTSGHTQGCGDSHTGSIRSRYFDIASGLASHCSLHSCTSSEFQPADSASYTTSISTDTLFYDPNSENVMASRQHSTKSRQSTCQQQQQQAQHQHQHHHQHHQQQHQAHQYMHHLYQQRYHITATQIQPAQIFPNTAYVHKPKSWDNLTAANLGAYGYGYGYLDTVAMKPVINLQIAQQRHSIPRKNPYGRYSAYTDVENYAPPPTEFLEQVTTTTTTITAKSADDILASPQGAGPGGVISPSPCECVSTQQHQQAIKMAQMQINQNHPIAHHNNCQMGYYSHLPQPKTDAATSTAPASQSGSTTVTEVTRL